MDYVQSHNREPEWLWDGILERGAAFVTAARSKAGKSVLWRCLAVRVAGGGGTLLNRKVAPGRVLGVITDEPDRYVARHFRQLLPYLNGHDDTLSLIARRDLGGLDRGERMAAVEREAERLRPDLIIFDTLFTFWTVRGEKSGDYTTMIRETKAVPQLAETYGAAVLSIHHAPHYRSGPLGSVAVEGGYDGTLILQRRRNARIGTLSAEGRGDVNVDGLRWTMADDGMIYEAGKPEEPQPSASDRIVAFLMTESSPRTVAEICEAVELGEKAVRSALDRLVQDGEVERTGSGNRGDPYSFRCPHSL